jgi:hypothetical protein
MALKTVDYTRGNPPKGREYNLTLEFHTGSRYSFYGKTKKEALQKFKKKFGTSKGFVRKEWRFED